MRHFTSYRPLWVTGTPTHSRANTKTRNDPMCMPLDCERKPTHERYSLSTREWNLGLSCYVLLHTKKQKKAVRVQCITFERQQCYPLHHLHLRLCHLWQASLSRAPSCCPRLKPKTVKTFFQAKPVPQLVGFIYALLQ